MQIHLRTLVNDLLDAARLEHGNPHVILSAWVPDPMSAPSLCRKPYSVM
jgi:signal transduction histidine kinase